MKEAGILDGDYVVVRKQPHVPSGAIAVAYLDGQATIKMSFIQTPDSGKTPERPWPSCSFAASVS
jgi:repressor LexA